MITTGRNLQVTMATCTLFLHVPFKHSKRQFTDLERVRAEAVYQAALQKRNSIVLLPWSRSDRENMLDGMAEFELSPNDRELLIDMINGVLDEYHSDESIRPYIPPGIKLADLCAAPFFLSI